MDVEYNKVSEVYVLNSEYHVASAVVRSQMLGVGASHLEEKIMKFAIAQFAFRRLAGGELVACCEGQAYDETPLRAGLKGECVVKCADGIDGEAVKQQLRAAAGMQMVGGALAASQQSAICKVLQTVQSHGFLVKLGSTFITIGGEQAVPLQILQRNAAEIAQEALCRNSSSTAWSESFHAKVRFTSSDKAGSILKAERSLSYMRPAGRC